MENYNTVKEEFNKIISKMNYHNIKERLTYYPVNREYVNAVLEDAFTRKNIKIKYRAIYKIDYIQFKDEKVTLSFTMQDGSWFYDVSSMHICVNGIDVSYTDGKWYNYIIDTVIPNINDIVNSVYDYLKIKDEEARAEIDLKLDKCNEIFS